jgi:chemotaxis response regulator CheB
MNIDDTTQSNPSPELDASTTTEKASSAEKQPQAKEAPVQATQTPTSARRFPIVVIGASAGGL